MKNYRVRPTHWLISTQRVPSLFGFAFSVVVDLAAPAMKSGALLNWTATPSFRTTRVFWFSGLTWIIPAS